MQASQDKHGHTEHYLKYISIWN